MKAHLILIWTIFFVFCFQTVDAQKVLLLQKPGTSKRFFYNVGDKISVQVGTPEFNAKGEITYIDDSVFTLDRNFTFPIANVKEVIRVRHWFYVSWRTFFAASVLYAGGSMINRGIHDEEPLIDNTVPIVSGSLIAMGTASYFLRYKKCKMEDNWKLKVLDYDIFKEKEPVTE
jgi:hypothetical protein